MNWAVVDGEVVVVDSKTADTHELAGSAAIVWVMLDAAGAQSAPTAADLWTRIEREFHVPRDHTSVELEHALEELFTRGLITKRADGR